MLFSTLLRTAKYLYYVRENRRISTWKSLLRGLTFGAMMLLSTQFSFGQLDCGGAVVQGLGENVSGDFASGSNNVTSYTNGSIAIGGGFGNEVIHKLENWPGGDLTIAIQDQNNIGLAFLLDGCMTSNGSGVFLEELNTSGETTVTGVAAGDVYVVVEGPLLAGTPTGYFLQFKDPNASLDCSNPVQLTVNQLYVGTTVGGNSNNSVYNDDPFWQNTGPEVVHIFDWLGGDATFELSSNVAVDPIVLSACDPGSASYITGRANSGGTWTETRFLAPGQYYVIIDGWQGAEGNYDFIVTGAPTLDCANAIEINHLVKYQGSFSNAVNNFTDYGGRGENLTGREVLVKIDLPATIWLTGNVYFDLIGDAEKLIFLNSCDPNDVFAGPLIDPGTAQLLTGANTQTYYAIVEGPSNGGDGNFELTIRRDHLDCNDERPITVGQATDPNSIKFAPYTYVNNYCGDPNSTKLELQEAIYKLSGWPGGDFTATMSDMLIAGSSWDDAALILLTDCQDPATCVVPPVINNGGTELTLNAANLPAGDYFIVVDGVTGFGLNPTFVLTVDAPSDMYCAAEGRAGTGSDYITSVNLNTLSNTSEKTQYSDFTDLSTTLDVGTEYTLEIGLRFHFDPNAAYGWIDYDQNGVFEPSELINMSDFDASHFSRGTFTVPAGAKNGATRMRVRSIFLNPQVADPCGSYFGEVEDYTVVIQGAVDKPDYEPTNFRVRDGNTSIVQGASFTIDLDIENNGSVDGKGNGGFDKYYLNTSPDLSGNPVFLRQFGTADINAGQSFEVNSGPMAIPANTTPGTYYILFFHDADNKVDESNEDNNLVSVQITVTEDIPGQLDASYTFNPAEPCPGETVQFTNTTTGLIAGAAVSYSWTFQNGTPASSSLENPAVTFPAPGTYDVELTATQNGVSNSTFGSVTVENCIATCDFQLADVITINSGNPVEEYVGINNGSGTNNIETYTTQDGTAMGGYNSPELIYEINWSGGDFEAFLRVPQGSNLIGIFLLKECDPASVSNFSISNVGITTVRKIAIQDLASGTYYLVIDSKLGETRPFDLRVSNTGLDCNSGGQITIDGNNPSVVLANQSTTNNGVNNIDCYGLITNLAGASYVNRTGPELVYELNWPGGELTASIDIQGSTSLDLILLQECLSTTVLEQVDGSGLQQITTDLAAGTYYLVVDGFLGRSGNYTLSVSGTITGGGEPDWPVVETGDNHTVIVQSSVVVDIDGMGLSTGDYIGAFYMDGAVERCGGKIRWEGENVSISVFGDDTGTGAKDGFSAGETFKWRVWKASSQQEFEVDVTYQPIGGIFTHQENYTTNGISGWATAIYDPIQVQTITLQPGWNIISSYIDATDPNMAAVFDAIKGSIALVKDEAGTTYIPAFDINGIGDWIVEEGYQVKVNGNSALDLSIEGMQVDPLTTPLNLKMGWNFMAYLKDTPQNTIDALSGITDKIVLVKNSDGQTYVPVFNINRIGDMLPGQGYPIKLNADAIFNYSANARVAGPLGQEMSRAQQISSLQPDWPVVQTGDNHTIIIEGSIASDFDGASLLPGDYVGVFYDVEGTLVCGGKAEWTGENIAMSAFGDDSGSADKDGFAASETFVWKVWRASDGKEFDAVAEYSPTGAVISHTDMFTINGISGIASLTEATSTSISSFRDAGIKLFPNPSNGQFWIELPDFAKAEVKVFNYTGQLVKETTFQGESRKQVDLSNQPQGMYVVHVEQAGKIAVSKVQINR